VIVINADKVELTGQKAEKKVAYRHSGYPGGIKGIRYTEYLDTRPVAAVEKAVRGMLPHNRLGRQIIKKLHVVAGPEHPHQAQQPVAIGVGERPSWDGFPPPAPLEEPSSPKREATPAAEDEREPKAPSTEAAEQPTAKKPTAKKTTAKKPTAKKTTAKKTTAKKPATKKDEE
jgi:large subunit ribosomal protein L13